MKSFLILFSLIGVFAQITIAAPVQVISTPNPIARLKMSHDDLDKVEKSLGPNRWVAGARCNLRMNKRFVNQKFMRGDYKGNVLLLEFETDHLGPRKAWASVSLNSMWGSKIVNDPEFGPVEEVRIELNDTDGTWVQYRYDGKYLTQFEIGNVRGIAPCLRP